MKSNLFIIFVAAYLLTGCAGPIPERHYKEPQVQQPTESLENRDILIKMAEKKFGKLTEADKKLFNAVATAEDANYAKGEGKDKPDDANSWGEERIIDANRIEWLCHNKQAKELVTDKGIQVIGAKIKGAVDLSLVEISFPLGFSRCVFEEKIDLMFSKIKTLWLDGSYAHSITADEIRVENCVFLSDGFKVKGEVRFTGAVIGGDFACAKGEFINEDGYAIVADRMDVKGSVFLGDGFKANGEVRFLGAAIGGNFDCHKGEFINEDGDAISADGINVKGNVFLSDGFKVNGKVRFPGAVIGENFECENGEFINKGGRAISASGMDVKGSVLLKSGFKANGEVRFPRAAIGGDFDCSDGNFVNVNKKGNAIFADRMDVKGGVFLRDGFKANGEVCFLGAVIGKDFDCSNGEFIKKGGRAISADGMDVKGSVFLCDGFKANGEVRFPVATIGGIVECKNGEFVNEGGQAIFADGMEVKGSVFLRDGFKAEGLVGFRGTTVGGHFFWRNVNLTRKTRLDLRNAKAGVLCDDKKSWPVKGNSLLDGFVYEDIGDDSPKDAKSRIEWLNRQDANQFQPGPYEQLAKVFERMGQDEDAIKIRIEKEKEITKHGGFGWWRKFRRGVLYWTIGYGYRPWWALRWIGAIIVIGFGVFWGGHKAGVIVPMEKDARQGGHLRKGYPKFSFLGFSFLGALVYSIDMFVPVLDLRMAKYWIPDANKSGKFLRFIPVRGDFVRGYMWLHIIAGWILTTLLIVGLTGLIKK